MGKSLRKETRINLNISNILSGYLDSMLSVCLIHSISLYTQTPFFSYFHVVSLLSTFSLERRLNFHLDELPVGIYLSYFNITSHDQTSSPLLCLYINNLDDSANNTTVFHTRWNEITY